MIILMRLCVILSLGFTLGSCSIFADMKSGPGDRSPISGSGNIPVSDRIAPSESFKEEFSRPLNEVREYKEYVLTRTGQSMNLDKPAGTLNNMVADMLRWHVSRIQGKQVDVGYVPYRLLADSLRQGRVRVADVYRIIPKDTPLALYRVNGMLLQQLADSLAARGGGAVGGMRLRIKEKQANDVLVGSQSIRYDASYYLAAPADLFSDEDGLTLKDSLSIDAFVFDMPVTAVRFSPEIESKRLLSVGLRELIIQYMDNQKIINRNPDFRIR